jgi:hypothetical protein
MERLPFPAPRLLLFCHSMSSPYSGLGLYCINVMSGWINSKHMRRTRSIVIANVHITMSNKGVYDKKSGRKVEGVELRLFAFWDGGFEFR